MTRHAELVRQQALIEALRTPGAAWPEAAARLPGRADGSRPEPSAGMQAYRTNAQAVAERALAAAYPVVARLVGDEAVSALARDLWRHHPPVRGDLAWFGAELAAWIERVPEWREWPYLADVARLEWAVHRAHTAPDMADTPAGLDALAQVDPDDLAVDFVAGAVGLASNWPLVALWQAHQGPVGATPDLAAVRVALQAGQGELAWVWRRGHQVQVVALPPDQFLFNAELLAGRALGQALQGALSAHADFSFENWLIRALRDGWLAGLRRLNSNH
ncbi:DNA-binding domain-containing protein [Ideonella sp. DXS29W]|uniref:DNA-binding domain-containing protein n=1 Tax=Ideonella lacteola TaxID=2984193 RepID=A0ABU9BHG3_9BURK